MKSYFVNFKNQNSSSQMSALNVDTKMITDKGNICGMWAEHFEKLGLPSTNKILTVLFLIELLTAFKNS